MNKNIIFLLFLLGFSACLKISHLEETPESVPSTQEVPAVGLKSLRQQLFGVAQTSVDATPQVSSKPQLENKMDMIQAYERLLEFIGSDKAMANSIIKDLDTPAKSQKRLKKFMIQDPYFQQQLINKLLENPANQWVEQLSFEDQIKYLQISTSLTDVQAQDTESRERVVAQLLEDPEIGAALRKKYGENINVEDIMQTSDVNIQPTVAHKLYKQISSVKL